MNNQMNDELVRVHADLAELRERCTALEAEVGTLSNLYVASQRLHETLDRSEVLRAIEEILINLVGSEELAIFEVDARATTLSLISSFGIERERYEQRPLGDGPLARAVRTGKTVVVSDETRSEDEPHLTACVPLKLRERVIGVIAVFQLLPQKPRLEALDHDLFELLTTAGATALHNARPGDQT
jgi:nitrate/nitrite-specific signal transduction histidine kinase